MHAVTPRLNPDREGVSQALRAAHNQEDACRPFALLFGCLIGELGELGETLGSVFNGVVAAALVLARVPW